MHKLHFNFKHIGDQVCTTAIPENVYNVTGQKCIITDDSIWAFKHNPYVVFMTEEEAKDYPTISLIPDCRMQNQVKKYSEMMNNLSTNGQTEFMCVNLGFNDVRLRHPRLYLYEDSEIIPNKIVVHTTGSDRTRDKEPAIRTNSGEDQVRVMSDEVCSAILENYKNFTIVQVGGADDKPLGGHSVNLCGKLDYWEVAKEIAESARFVGVNSGPMHIANCYPRVEKRVVLMEFPRSTLMTFRPGDIRNWLFSWIDVSSTYFNKTDIDIGYSYSYKKI
jgi:hypothetical protein